MRWTKEDTQFLKDNYKDMTNKELARCLNRTALSIKYKKQQLNLRKGKAIYALYKGDQIVVVGTAEEIAESQNVKTQTVRKYATKSHHDKVSYNAKKVFRIE